MQRKEYLSEQIHERFCKEWVYFTLSATKGKVDGCDVSFLLCGKHAVLCTVEIYGVEDKAGAIPSPLSVSWGLNLFVKRKVKITFWEA